MHWRTALRRALCALHRSARPTWRSDDCSTSACCSLDLIPFAYRLHEQEPAGFFNIGFGRYALVMVLVDLASITAALATLMIYFRRDIPATYDVGQLDRPEAAMKGRATSGGWVVLAMLLAAFFLLEPLGVPVSAVAAVGPVLLLVIAARGHVRLELSAGATRF